MANDLSLIYHCFFTSFSLLLPKRRRKLPRTARIIPIAMIIEPLIVHFGLSYMNDDDGPTTDLLCKLKITPIITTIIPTIIMTLPILFIVYRKIGIQDT